MKKLLMCVLLTAMMWPLQTHAVCTEYEYAEIKEMNKQEMEEAFCKALSKLKRILDAPADYRPRMQCNNTVSKLQRAHRRIHHQNLTADFCASKNAGKRDAQ